MPTTPTSLSSHRLVPMGEGQHHVAKEGQVANLQLHSLHSSCIGWSLQVSPKQQKKKLVKTVLNISRSVPDEDSVKKGEILFLLQDYMIFLFPLLK